MSFGPGGANASSAAQPAATESFEIISAEQPVQYPYSCCCLDVRWQVEHSSGQWWDIPQSAAIDWFYKEAAAGVEGSHWLVLLVTDGLDCRSCPVVLQVHEC